MVAAASVSVDPIVPPGPATRLDQHVCLLGPEIEHGLSLHSMLLDRVAGVSWLPDSHTYIRKNSLPARSKLRRGLDALSGTRMPAYLQHVAEHLDQHQARALVGYWGTLPISDLVAIKRLRPDLRTILMLLCYPLSLTRTGVLQQRLALRRAGTSLDGVLCPTTEMADYLERHVWRGARRPDSLVLPPCWPAAFQSKNQAPPSRERQNVVYVGRTDLSGATVHAADDVRPLMREILEAGIELHHGHSRETDDGHPLRRPFTHRPLPELITLMGSFDASLVAYNTAACGRVDRFDLTVPDRLLSSVAAGVPVAIPRAGYAASKTYVRDYGALIEFESGADLHRQLADRGRVEELRQRAWAARSRYSAEAQGDRLVGFLTRLAAGSS